MSEMDRPSCVTPRVGELYYINFSKFGRPDYSWLPLKRLNEEEQSWVCGVGECTTLTHGNGLVCIQTNIVLVRPHDVDRINEVSAPGREPSIIRPAFYGPAAGRNNGLVISKPPSAVFLSGEKVVALSLDCISVDNPGKWRYNPNY